MPGAVLTSDPGLIGRVADDLRALGHADGTATALALNLVRSWRGKVRPPSRQKIDLALREIERQRADGVLTVDEALDRLAGAKPKPEEVERIEQAALHRRTINDGLLRTLRTATGQVRENALDMAGQTLGERVEDVTECRRRLDLLVERDRLIIEAIRAKRRKRVQEAPAPATTAQPPSLGGVQTPVTTKGRTGQKARSPEFEKLHPRAPKGRVGGGTWIVKKGDGVDADPVERVKELQVRLSELGFKLAPDGRFGGVTEHALRNFQEQTGLRTTGELDDATVETLRNPPMNEDGTLRTLASIEKEEKAAAEKKGSKTSRSRGGGSARSGGTSEGSRAARGISSAGSGGRGGSDLLDPADPDSIKAFQREHDLKPSGIVDAQTQKALRDARERVEKAEEKRQTSSRRSQADDLVRRGDGMREPDSQVEDLQQQLQDLGFDVGEVDGRFGETTEKALRAFQQRYGLRVDGVAGPQTMEMLKRTLQREQKKKDLAVGESKEDVMADLTARLEEAVAEREHATGGYEFERARAREQMLRERLAEADEKLDVKDEAAFKKLVAKFMSNGMPRGAAEKAAMRTLQARRGGKAVKEAEGVAFTALLAVGESDLDDEQRALVTRRALEILELPEDEVEEAVLTAKARKRIAPGNFAIPPDRYPIHDLAHARNALARVAQNGTPEEQAKVRAAVYRKYPQLKKRAEEAVLTTKARKQLPKSAFAIPPDRYPIHDEAHARNALARVAQHGSPDEQKRVKAAVCRRYPDMGVCKERKAEEALQALLEVKSSALPDIPNKPGVSNWVERAGGLPKYIERIAKHLRSEKGMTTGRAIAVAVNAVKRMCATGDTNFPGAQQVNVKSRAEACAAVADWERKRLKSRATSEAMRMVEAAEREFTSGQLHLRWEEIVALVETLDGKDGERLPFR